MKHQLILALFLLGALLTWPACDPSGDPVDPDQCGFTVPTVAYSVGCEPAVVLLRGLNDVQAATRPDLPVTCPSVNDFNRIVRVANVAGDDDFYLHLYVGIPATISYSVIGTFCGQDAEVLVPCTQSSAVAISEYVTGAEGFDDVYVSIDYELFDGADYANYTVDSNEDIAVAVYDQLPGGPLVSYNQNDTGPSELRVNCDGSAFERLVVTACNPLADVAGYAAELGLPVTEQCLGNGISVAALEVPAGMSLNFLTNNDPPGGSGGPYTPIRRPKKDSTDFIVEPDFIITLPAADEDQFIELTDCPGDQTPLDIGAPAKSAQCFDPSTDERECLTWSLNGDSGQEEPVRLRVAIIDSGADAEGEIAGYWERYLHDNGEDYKYLPNFSTGYDFIRGDQEPNDEVGHGTTVALAMIGRYGGGLPLTILHLKVFGDHNLASYFGAVVAINTAIEARADVINMSWGIPLAEAPLALECAVDRAGQAGIAMVTSAGNENLDLEPAPQWPANFSRDTFGYDHLVTVGSMAYPDYDIGKAPAKVRYSNYGDAEVDVAAYLTAATPRFRGDLDDLVFIAGTSVSTPVVTGSLARYLQPGGPLGDAINTWRSERTEESLPLLSNGHVREGRYLPLCQD